MVQFIPLNFTLVLVTYKLPCRLAELPQRSNAHGYSSYTNYKFAVLYVAGNTADFRCA